ncbi:MAG: EMC3/TMCO1 family protein [archaeon]|nr:EMC3/TMCO1 family protein [archaeon]
MDKSGKGMSLTLFFVIMLISLGIASMWDVVPFIKNSVHAILDPSAGKVLDWNMTYGMLILVFIITLISTLFQKYGSDQKTIKEMRDEQKRMSEEMKKFKDDPKKLIEFQKKQFESMPQMMQLTMKPLVFTAIPFILFFRWFMDVFTALGNPKFFSVLSWFWFYLIFSIIFSLILRKIFKVY